MDFWSSIFQARSVSLSAFKFSCKRQPAYITWSHWGIQLLKSFTLRFATANTTLNTSDHEHEDCFWYKFKKLYKQKFERGQILALIWRCFFIDKDTIRMAITHLQYKIHLANIAYRFFQVIYVEYLARVKNFQISDLEGWDTGITKTSYQI